MFKIVKLYPQGFCFGVVSAIVQAKKAIKARKANQSVYLLGSIVHNDYVVREFKDLGCHFLDNLQATNEELIRSVPEGAMIVFSAHGISEKCLDIARKKNLDIINTTCSIVTNLHKIIAEKTAAKKQVIFIGKKNHPEAQAIKENFPKVIIVETKEDVLKLGKLRGNCVFATNQTTLSHLTLQDVYKTLQQKFPNIEIRNDICRAVYDRQKGILDYPQKLDLVLVIGDPKSHNSRKLVDVALTKHHRCYRIENSSHINPQWLKGVKTIGITAGASTPKSVVNQVVAFLEGDSSNSQPLKTGIL